MLLQTYGRSAPAHILEILRLYHSIAENMLDILGAVHLEHFLQSCATMLSTYFESCEFDHVSQPPTAPTARSAAASTLLESNQREQYHEMLACLRLFRVIIEWLRSEPGSAVAAATTSTFIGLLLPRIFASPDLLYHRKLVHTLFQNIHGLFHLPAMVCRYTEKRETVRERECQRARVRVSECCVF
jgi:hypothetical protein